MPEKRFDTTIDTDRLSPPDLKVYGGSHDASGLTFGIVTSRFNDTLTRQLVRSAVDCLTVHGAARKDLELAWVPGAFEIPLLLQQFARSGRFSALIALGAVIEGETPHADLITASVTRSLAALSLSFNLPVIDTVVAARTEEQARVRCAYGENSRGWYAGLAAIECATVMAAVNRS